MRIVLDTNCLLLIITKRGKYYPIFEKIQTGEIQLIVTTEIILEYEEVLETFYSQEVAYLILKAILNHRNTIIIEKIYYKWNLISIDADDNKFVDAYITGSGDYIVTNDKHFKSLIDVEFPAINIIRLLEFYKLEI